MTFRIRIFRPKKPHLMHFEEEYFRNELISRENANIDISAGSLCERYSEHLLLRHVFYPFLRARCPEALKAHRDGWIYIHKAPYILWLPYCGACKSQTVVRTGIETVNTKSNPPKHLDAAIDQLARTVISLSFERTGAVGLNDVDAVLAPFVKHDAESVACCVTKLADVCNNLDVYMMKLAQQQAQRFIFTMNNIERPSNQSPFSNVSLCFSLSEKVLSEMDVYLGGKKVGTALDYFDEVRTVVKAFLLMYWHGDAYGRPFTFPICTVLVNNGRLFAVLREDPELWELFWRVVAVRGSFYFMNIPERMVHSFCCRLMVDVDKIREFAHVPHGVWWIPALFGSINYVSINMPRIAFVAKDDNDLFELLLLYMEIAREVLNELRARHEYFYEIGMYPVTRRIAEAEGLKNVNIIREFYYNTIAVIGLAEAFNIWYMKQRDDYERELMHESKYVDEHVFFRTVWKLVDSEVVKACIDFYTRVLGFMNDVLREFEQEDDVMYNLEQAPAESASVKLAYSDLRLFGKKIEPYVPRDIDIATGSVVYYYTSQNTPYYTTASLDIQLDIEGRTQRLFTGGVVKILQVPYPFWMPEWSEKEKEDGLRRLEKLIEWAMIDKGLIYLAFTPVQNICLDCRYMWIGDPLKIEKCPKCGSKRIETWSRIVGYYRPVRMWNPGRRAEFTTRLKHAEFWFGKTSF